MSKYVIVAAVKNDALEQALLTNTIYHDHKAGQVFETVEQAHEALDDFCEQKGLRMSLFNVQDVAA